DRGPAVPDLVDDQDPLAAELRVRRELEERGLRAGMPLAVVVLDRRHQDVPEPEAIREHAGRDEPAAGDREEHVVVGPDPVRQAPAAQAVARLPGPAPLADATLDRDAPRTLLIVRPRRPDRPDGSPRSSSDRPGPTDRPGRGPARRPVRPAA